MRVTFFFERRQHRNKKNKKYDTSRTKPSISESESGAHQKLQPAAKKNVMRKLNTNCVKMMQKTNGYCTLAKHGLTAALITKGAYAIMRTERLRGVEIRWTFLVFFWHNWNSLWQRIKKHQKTCKPAGRIGCGGQLGGLLCTQMTVWHYKYRVCLFSDKDFQKPLQT